jgi:hypothetical protein
MSKQTVLVATLLLSLPAVLSAQAVAGFGGISGVVRDATGAVVPSADVIVENASKGIRRTLTSNDAGVFAAPALVPSSGYAVRVNKSGFQDFEVKDIEVLVGQNVNINATLAVSGAATQVEVTDAAPIVEQTKTGISQVVNSKQIQDLPINGRRVDAFALLTPAVVSDGTFGLISFRGIAGGNAFLTDGNDTTNNFYNENAGRTRITTQISQDAVQEFQVLGRILPRLGRRYQHVDPFGRQRPSWYRLLVLPQPGLQRPRSVFHREPGRAPRSVRRLHRRPH